MCLSVCNCFKDTEVARQACVPKLTRYPCELNQSINQSLARTLVRRASFTQSYGSRSNKRAETDGNRDYKQQIVPQ